MATPKMKIRHTRCQRAVGHGFFHSARIDVAGKTYRYIYDCGGKNIGERIDEYLHEDVNGGSLDALFVSHLHADHVGGLEQLLARVNVDTVVLPYLSFEERLLLTLESLDTPSASTAHWQALSNPASWFLARGAERVFEVIGWDPDIPPESNPPNPDLPDLGEVENDRVALEDAELHLKVLASARSSESGEETPATASQPKHGSSSTTITHDRALALVHHHAFWHFVTFVQHAPSDSLADFYSSVRKLLIAADRKLVDKRHPAALWAHILSNESLRRRLKQAYSAVFSDF